MSIIMTRHAQSVSLHHHVRVSRWRTQHFGIKRMPGTMRELRYSMVALGIVFVALFSFDWNVIKVRFLDDSQTGISFVTEPEYENKTVAGFSDEAVDPDGTDSDDEAVDIDGIQSDDDTISSVPSNLLFSALRYLQHPTRDDHVSIRYQCTGPRYDDFTTKLKAFSHTQVDQGLVPATWGDPEFAPLRPNQSILFLGNSHTRQLALAFLAQRYDGIVGYNTLLFPVEKRAPTKRRFDFLHNVTVFTITNSAIVHSPIWYDLVEEAIGRPMDSLDAVVLGLFNSCRLDAKTNYAKEMKQQEGIACLDYEGPKFDDVAAHYAGPLAMTTMFSIHRANLEQEAHAMVDALKVNRSNIEYIHSRKYIEAMGVECGAANSYHKEDCFEEGEARQKLHRCVGDKGGHPDLIAWEVREWIRQQTE